MRSKDRKPPVVRVLQISVAVLALVNIPIWYGVLAPNEPVLALTERPVATVVDWSPEISGEPIRLTIAGISLSSAVEAVSLADDGSMAVPEEPDNVAWYSPGPRPGETGSAVLAGHVDWFGGRSAAFADLNRLQPGDRIEVQDSRGATVAFAVREARLYGAEAEATEVFVSDDGLSHLNLITCDGVWDRQAGQYTERLVVFSDRVTE